MNNKILFFLFVILLIPLTFAETLGSEKVTCWEFNCSSSWINSSVGTSSAFRVINSTGIAVFSSIYFPSSGSLVQNIGVNQDEKYLVILNVKTTWFDWHDFWIELGGINSSVYNSTGNKSFYIVTQNSGNLTLWINRTYNQSMNANVIFESISVKRDLDYSPNITFTNGTQDSGVTVNQNYVYVNVSANNVQNITYYLYNQTGGIVNQTNYITPIYSINWTNLVDGLYFYNVSMYSTTGFLYSTDTRNITLYQPNLNIAFGYGTQDSGVTVNQNYVYVNVSATASSENTITFNLYNDSGIINSSSFTDFRRTINWATLPEGMYYYNVSINDTYGSINSTEQRTITIYWDTNISSCKILHDNIVYTQINDINSSFDPDLQSDCIDLQGSNITFNGGSYKINGGGISVTGSNNSINNFNVNKFVITEGMSNLIENSTIQNCTGGKCIDLTVCGNGAYNIFKNIYVNNSDGYAVEFWGISFCSGEGASHNVFQNCLFENTVGVAVYAESFFALNTNNTFINCTYNSETIGAGSLIRSWYYQTYVNDSLGLNVSGVNITAYNRTGNYNFNLTTDATGKTPQITITDYINNAGTKTYYSPYTIYAINSTYGIIHQHWNVTLQQNNIENLQYSCWKWDGSLLFVPNSCNQINYGNILLEIF